MLFLRRTHRVLGSGVERTYAALQRPGLRAYVVRTREFAFDTALLGPAMQASHPSPTRDLVGQLTLPLIGQIELRCDDRALALRAGEVAVDPPSGWNERWDPCAFEALVLEWTRDHGDPIRALEAAPLGPRDLERVTGFARALVS